MIVKTDLSALAFSPQRRRRRHVLYTRIAGAGGKAAGEAARDANAVEHGACAKRADAIYVDASYGDKGMKRGIAKRERAL